jgi:hypothetical protein
MQRTATVAAKTAFAMTLIAGVALIVSTADSQSDPAPSSDTNPAILADSASDSTKNAALLAFAEQIGQDIPTSDPLSDPLAAPLANSEFVADPSSATTADTIDPTVFERCQTDRGWAAFSYERWRGKGELGGVEI